MPRGNLGDDRLYGNDGANILHGDEGNDWLYALDESLGADSHLNQLYGGLRNDYLNGAAGIDVCYGQGGHDRFYDGAGNDGIDDLCGGDGNEKLHGLASYDECYGEPGNDVLYSGGVNGLLVGGSGDNIYVFNQHDWIHGSSGWVLWPLTWTSAVEGLYPGFKVWRD